MSMLITLLVSFLVQTQEDFTALPSMVREALKDAPDSVDIRLSKGVYFYKDNLWDWSGISSENTVIRILGDDAVLVGSDNGETAYRIENGYVDLNSLCHVDTRTEMRQAYLWPVRIPFHKGLYMIHCKGETPLPKEELSEYTLLLSQWYIGALYPIEKITRNHIFFRRETKYSTGMWSELRYGRCFPRYLLWGPPKEDDGPKLYACRATRFLTVENTSLKELSIEGVRFLGNGDGDWMIKLKDLKTERVEISRCHFEGIRSGCVYVEATDHFLMHDSEMRKCYRWGVYVWTSSHDCVIRNNRFIDNGLRVSFNPVVDCKADGFLIADNYFEDFSYSAIGAGNHYAEPDTKGTRGIIENNEICMSDDFRSRVFRSLIDSGAIYVWTKNNGLIIRNNYIHDIAGAHGNRGILCDDAAVNVRIEGNRIVRINNGYCIDLRKKLRVGRKKKSTIRTVNVGNVMQGNIIDGPIRFEVRRNDPTSLKGENIVI